VSCGRIATIFTWPNASGPDGALRRFGTGRKGDFDFERV
jgi:benzoyl-CoA-dihydrodiol lyase